MLNKTQISSKSCINHFDTKKLNLFEKRSVIFCPPAIQKINRLLQDNDTYSIITKNLSPADHRTMRLVCKKAKTLFDKIQPLHSFKIDLIPIDLFNPNNKKLAFIKTIQPNDRPKIHLKNVSPDNDSENLINFISNSDNAYILKYIEHIEFNDDIHDDNIEPVQNLINLFTNTALPSLSSISFKALWADITFNSLLPLSLSFKIINAPLDLKNLPNLVSLKISKTIMAPILFPDNPPSLTSITYERIVDVPGLEQKIEQLPKAIQARKELETKSVD